MFNVLELFEASRFSTYEAAIECDSAEGLMELERVCEGAGIEIEDWTANMRNLCKACSEGRPHEGHDEELGGAAAWAPKRRVGFAALSVESLNGVLEEWAVKLGRSVSEKRCTLKAEPT